MPYQKYQWPPIVVRLAKIDWIMYLTNYRIWQTETNLIKGQLISERLFGVLNFPKNSAKLLWISALRSKFRSGQIIHSEINWPLVKTSFRNSLHFQIVAMWSQCWLSRQIRWGSKPLQITYQEHSKRWRMYRARIRMQFRQVIQNYAAVEIRNSKIQQKLINIFETYDRQ